MIYYNQLTSHFLLEYFPELNEDIKNEMNFLQEELPHCLYPDVLIPYLMRFFRFSETKYDNLVKKIFGFFEYLASNGDCETKNLLQVSLLEPLWDYKKSYAGALQHMDSETKKIFIGMSSYLNKPMI